MYQIKTILTNKKCLYLFVIVLNNCKSFIKEYTFNKMYIKSDCMTVSITVYVQLIAFAYIWFPTKIF